MNKEVENMIMVLKALKSNGVDIAKDEELNEIIDRGIEAYEVESDEDAGITTNKIQKIAREVNIRK